MVLGIGAGHELVAQSIGEVLAHGRLVQEVIQEVMVEGVHYGIIPGTKDVTLYKAGSEKLLTVFRISADPQVIDLSIPGERRYQVRVIGRSMVSGVVVGVGIGECSSDESKYKWRTTYNQAEWEAAPEARRRIKYSKNNKQDKQVRVEPADVANTVLKMAKKRAQVDLCCTALAASDVFDQQPAPVAQNGQTYSHQQPKPQRPQQPQQQPPNGGAKESLAPPPEPFTEGGINENQARMLRAALERTGTDELALCQAMEVDSIETLQMAQMNDALGWVKEEAVKIQQKVVGTNE